MTKPSKGARIDQSLDVHGNFLAQIAFHFMVPVYELPELDDLILAQILHTGLAVNAGLSDEVSRGASPYPIDIGETDIHSLLPRKVNSSYASHLSSSIIP